MKKCIFILTMFVVLCSNAQTAKSYKIINDLSNSTIQSWLYSGEVIPFKEEYYNSLFDPIVQPNMEHRSNFVEYPPIYVVILPFGVSEVLLEMRTLKDTLLYSDIYVKKKSVSVPNGADFVDAHQYGKYADSVYCELITDYLPYGCKTPLNVMRLYRCPFLYNVEKKELWFIQEYEITLNFIMTATYPIFSWGDDLWKRYTIMNKSELEEYSQKLTLATTPSFTQLNASWREVDATDRGVTTLYESGRIDDAWDNATRNVYYRKLYRDGTFIGGLRQQNDTIFFFSDSVEKKYSWHLDREREHMLYHFSWQPGDSLTLRYCDTGEIYTSAPIMQFDSILLEDGNHYPMVTLDNGLRFVKGFGCIDGFFPCRDSSKGRELSLLVCEGDTLYNNSHAQKMILSDGSSWDEVYYSLVSNPPTKNYIDHFCIKGDTVISGKRYQKIFNNDTLYAAFCCTDTLVYLFDFKTGKEVQQYDFNWYLGKEIIVCNCIDNPEEYHKYRITQIDSIVITRVRDNYSPFFPLFIAYLSGGLVFRFQSTLMLKLCVRIRTSRVARQISVS